jgi:hypothetical protein
VTSQKTQQTNAEAVIEKAESPLEHLKRFK